MDKTVYTIVILTFACEVISTMNISNLLILVIACNIVSLR